ncbi:MAG: 2,3-diphosphoglycerate synthetase, partial [Actinomycetota bacterium]
ASRQKVDSIIAGIKELKPELEVIPTVLRPRPDGDINGRRVAYFTTAQGEVVEHIKEFISSTYGCTIDFVSTELADRKKLRAYLAQLKDGDVDVFLTEIKAAAIDVVAEEADRRGVEVVFCDNVPVEIDGQERLAPLLVSLAEQAIEDFRVKNG